jgi:hypothetical protein
MKRVRIVKRAVMLVAVSWGAGCYTGADDAAELAQPTEDGFVATSSTSGDGDGDDGDGGGPSSGYDGAETTADGEATSTGDEPVPGEGPCPWPAPASYPYMLGESAFGDKDYIEYIPGDLPVILTAPHGGSLEPAEIPPQEGVLAKDGGSLETTLLLYEYLHEETGRTPHVIINHLTRHRLNANRDRDGASYGNEHAAHAWDEFHDYIEDAKSWVTASCGKGHLFDMHTNGHSEAWNEMGFALTSAELDLPDDQLDTQELREKSTVRSLVTPDEVSFVEVLRGPTSLGGLLDAMDIKAVPSPTHPGPDGGGYFTGGYNVRRHGSRDGGVIDSTQIESHFSYINAGAAAREDYSRKLTEAVIVFMETHYAFDLSPS